VNNKGGNRLAALSVYRAAAQLYAAVRILIQPSFFMKKELFPMNGIVRAPDRIHVKHIIDAVFRSKSQIDASGLILCHEAELMTLTVY
jgi:hypothetical protein